MNIFIDASNVHQGGGKILLFEFLSSIPENVRLDITVYIDYRLTLTQKLKSAKHIKFKRISFWKRPFVQVIIFFRSSKAKSILFFGNIPPIIPMRAQTFLLQSNRFVIENFTTKGMSFFHRLRINLERFIFYFFNRNVDYIFVQSLSMKRLLMQHQIPEEKVIISANKDIEELNNAKKEYYDMKYDFIYIASDEPHKNHKNLLQAWRHLSKENIFPSLLLITSKDTWISPVSKSYNKEFNTQITVLEDPNREAVLESLNKSKSLVFPSLFESYGLPLIEAQRIGLEIIASELDYVRDIIEPDQSFDPNSYISISRAIKRSLKLPERKTKILNPDTLLEYLTQETKDI